MTPITKEPLLPPGNLRIKTKQLFPVNETINHEEGAKYTSLINTMRELGKRFLDIPKLYTKTLRSGCQVNTHIPAGAYSPGALQVTAIRNEIVERAIESRDDELQDVRTIYDYPEDAKIEYFRQVLTAFKCVQQTFSKYTDEDYQVIFTENAASVVSNEKHRVGRTVCEPHTQISVVPKISEPIPDAQKTGLLSSERQVIRIMRDYISQNIVNLDNSLFEKTGSHFEYEQREAPPFGYTIKTNININGKINDEVAVLLSKIMTSHHEMYAKISSQLVDQLKESNHTTMKNKILPQPSYRVYGTVDKDGLLSISISPSIFAMSGVIEAAGRGIVRDPDNSPFFGSEETEAQYYGAVAELLESQSSG